MQLAQPGQSVSVLFYVDGRPQAVRAQVHSVEPFVLTTSDASAEHLNSGLRAVLIIQRGNEFSKAEALLSANKTEAGWELRAKDFGWEKVDRRRYPRYPIQMPVKVRSVVENSDGVELKMVQAYTEDISLGGAWLKSDDRLESGLLVEFQADLPMYGTIRVLSVVRWNDTLEKQGFGVEFLDFVAGSRQSLNQMLSKAA